MLGGYCQQREERRGGEQRRGKEERRCNVGTEWCGCKQALQSMSSGWSFLDSQSGFDSRDTKDYEARHNKYTFLNKLELRLKNITVKLYENPSSTTQKCLACCPPGSRHFKQREAVCYAVTNRGQRARAGSLAGVCFWSNLHPVMAATFF